MRYINILLYAGDAAVPPGCVNMATYNEVRAVDTRSAQQAEVDAKQRVVLTVSGTTRLNGIESAVVRTCAKPSPDALSAIALGDDAGSSAAKKASIQAAFALSETPSDIGLRTPSIQLMHDAMYRLCEGVASGSRRNRFFDLKMPPSSKLEFFDDNENSMNAGSDPPRPRAGVVSLQPAHSGAAHPATPPPCHRRVRASRRAG
ncbi:MULTISPECIES: hypothetical protein [unclassified Sphingomonas]|jgi:hypothetical protein|uniref:hypothetical protein n=1 Tax=unclassified Sphingomonas TaxID=196159 RepID=UPI000E105BCB|nr:MULTISPECIES: hypothetical protein [unclassified Sphingomonas]AXJ96278.1 hypothetical protein DM480_12995 [Sphingomonas sp. FARSPH]